MIGKKVLLASSSITYVVDKLEEKGYIERAACPNDRRVTHARRTEKGAALMGEIFPQHTDALTKFFYHLSEEELTNTISRLSTIGWTVENEQFIYRDSSDS